MTMSCLYSRFNRKTLHMGLFKFTVADGKIVASQGESQGGRDRATSSG